MSARSLPRAFACLFLLQASTLACRFDPEIPEGTIACQHDGECPADLFCRLGGRAGEPGLCCRTASCGGSAPQPPPSSGGPAGTPAAGPDAGAPPSIDPLPPADAAAGPDAAAPTDAAGPGENGADLVSCAATFTTVAAGASEKLHCTISLQGDYAFLKLDLIARNDPVTTRDGSSCWAPLPLDVETVDGATGAARPLGKATADKLVQVIAKMQQLCTQAKGNLVGAVADSWGRRAPNAQEIAARVRAETGLTLEIPSESEALTQVYLGLSRNRRGRVVFNDWPVPQLLVWPARASAPTRTAIPVSFAAAGAMYLASTTYDTFDAARYALRNSLTDPLRAELDAISTAVRTGQLASNVAVGRTDATIPLAVKGRLHDAMRVWMDPEAYKRAVDGAMLSLTSYGWDYGIVTPSEIDAFFPSITSREFTQLRSAPLRSTYAEYLILDTVMLDVLNDESDLTEFGFPQTFFHYGYLFSKLFPAPAAM
jgi:hypothetical protein